MKLSLMQSTLLRLMAEAPGGCWYPHHKQYLEGKWVLIEGAGVANSIKALYRMGLAEPLKFREYASQITELGKQVAEQEKGKPVKNYDW